MGADLMATVVPKLDDYDTVIDRADAYAITTAAFHAAYLPDFDGDDELAAQAEDLMDRIDMGDHSVIDLLANRTEVVDELREAARTGARFVTQHHFSSAVYDASQLGGPDVLVVGGSSFGDDPCEEFRAVALLAAVIARNLGDVVTAQVTTKS